MKKEKWESCWRDEVPHGFLRSPFSFLPFLLNMMVGVGAVNGEWLTAPFTFLLSPFPLCTEK